LKIQKLSFAENLDEYDDEKLDEDRSFAKPENLNDGNTSSDNKPMSSLEALKAEQTCQTEVTTENTDDNMKNELSSTEDNEINFFNEKQMFKKRLGKNPDVDTSFLPDREREEEENHFR
jgi:hypothetical protein